jgi:hypothetical protein
MRGGAGKRVEMREEDEKRRMETKGDERTREETMGHNVIGGRRKIAKDGKRQEKTMEDDC